MLTVLGSARRCCDGLTRRETLKAGALGLLGGFGLPQLLQAQQQGVAGHGRAKSVICLYLLGGAPTQDMVDLKPNAPTGIRSEFHPIATSVPGIQVCEHLPRMAQWMHKIAVVRSLHHQAGCHNPLPSYSGHGAVLPQIVATSDAYPPSMGSVLEYLRQNTPGPRAQRDLPDYVYMPCYLGWGQAIRRPGPYAGFLGQRYDALYTECTPYQDPGAPPETPGHPGVIRGVPTLAASSLPAGLTLDVLNTRQDLLQQLDEQVQLGEGHLPLDNFGRAQQQAFNLITSPQVRAAFDLGREDPRTIDSYGRTLFGNSTLLARRLVEAGVRFVNVTWDIYWDRLHLQYDGWDTHTRNFPILREVNLPCFDMAYSALVEDLENRGLLDETLIIVLSEMGRTPQINGNGGRDHWTYCFSTWLAGGGIRGGTLYGESDSQAAYVKDFPVSPADLCATVYDCLGVDPDMTLPDRSGRPVPISQGGRPIREIMG
jgi:hypothetical protein